MSNFQAIGRILGDFKADKDKYISAEFQKYGYDLAVELNDLKNKSLYIKLAKTTPRGVLENARNFVKDSYQVRNKAALFLWKIGEMRKKSQIPMTNDQLQIMRKKSQIPMTNDKL